MKILARMFAVGLCSLSGISPLCAAPKPKDEVVTARDNGVLAAVLADLLSYEGEDCPVRGPFSLSRPLPFAKDPAREEISADDVLYRHETKRWESLTPEQTKTARQAAEHLARRADAPGGQFAITESKIELRGPRRKPSEFSDTFDRPIQAHLPGYSAKGEIAIVRLSIPWSIHSVDGTYILISEGGAWKVLLRQFVYYL